MDGDTDAHINIELVRKIKDILLLLTISCLVMAIYAQFYFEAWKGFNHRLVLYIRISTILQCSAVYLDDGEPGLKCSLTAFLFQYSGFSQHLWICMLSTSLALHIFRQYKTDSHERLMLVMCFFLCPVPIAMLPFITDDYQVNGPTCRIARSEWGKFWSYKIFMPTLMLGTTYIALMNIFMHVYIWKRGKIHPNQTSAYKILTDEYLKPLTWLTGISIILYLVRVWIKMIALSKEEGNLCYLIHCIVFCGWSFVLSVVFQNYSGIHRWLFHHQPDGSVHMGRNPFIAQPDTTESNSLRIQHPVDTSSTSSHNRRQILRSNIQSSERENSANRTLHRNIQHPADYSTTSSDAEQRNVLTHRNNI